MFCSDCALHTGLYQTSENESMIVFYIITFVDFLPDSADFCTKMVQNIMYIVNLTIHKNIERTFESVRLRAAGDRSID